VLRRCPFSPPTVGLTRVQSTPVWQEVWGDHLHHGLYPGGKARKDHQQAQVGCCQVLSLETARQKGSQMLFHRLT